MLDTESQKIDDVAKAADVSFQSVQAIRLTAAVSFVNTTGHPTEQRSDAITRQISSSARGKDGDAVKKVKP
jgi:hypothetical protein